MDDQRETDRYADETPGRARWAAAIVARPRLVLAIAAAVALTAAALASRLSLRTAFTELLPSRDPAVLALRRTEARVGNLNLLTVGIRSPDRAANLRYAAALTEALRRLPRSQVDLVAYHLRDLQAFFHDNRWLYAKVEDLESVRDRLRREILKRKNPMVVSLGDEDDDAAADKALRQRLDQSPVTARFPDGYFVQGDVAWVLVLPAADIFGEHAGEAPVAAVDAFVAAHPPAAFHPAMRVGCVGPVISALENRRAIEQDIVGVTIACTLLVALSMILYFRQVRSVVLVVAAAALGTTIAFATGDVAFGYLNSTTAFLGSIILGNGINHPIVLLSRIRELLPRGAAPGRAATAAAVRTAMAGTGRATLTAALAAAAAYLSLTLTSFRGFSQFGVMAAVGSLGCWAAAYTVVPAWIIWRAGAGNGRAANRAPASLAPLARALPAWAPALVVVGAAFTLAALFGLRHFAGAPFEYDFRRLRADVARTTERKQLDDSMTKLLGHWPSPIVVVADRLSQVEAIKAAIRAKDSPSRPVIEQVVTIYDVLPGTPEMQRRKLALLAQIRRLTDDPGLAALSDEQRADVARLRPPETLRALGPEDLPPLARRPFTETDGTVGRVVLAYHASTNVSMWEGHDLLAMARVLQELRLPDGSVIESSGTPMIFGAMLRSVLHDGPRATTLSLLAVAALILVLMRGTKAKVAAVATLLVGVLWMIGAAGLLGVRITFLNFIALPITFGVGGEYALNVVARWRREGSMPEAVRSVGGAVLLCSWTTIIGYGSLLAAHSQALRGFGAMAILGEIACLSAALVVTPAVVVWWRSRSGHKCGQTAREGVCQTPDSA